MSHLCPKPFRYRMATMDHGVVHRWAVTTHDHERSYRWGWVARLVGWFVQRIPPNERADLSPTMFWWLSPPTRRVYPYRPEDRLARKAKAPEV